MSNTSNTLPTLEEIELYQKGKLSAARTAEIKSLASTNPLVAEALEGFAILPVFAAVPGAESFLNMVANAQGGAAASGAASSAAASTGAASTGAAVVTDVAVKTAAWFGAKTLIIAGVSATVAVTGTLLVVNQNSDESQTTENSTTLSEQHMHGSNPSTESSEVATTLQNQPLSGEASSAAEINTSINTTIDYTAALQNTLASAENLAPGESPAQINPMVDGTVPAELIHSGDIENTPMAEDSGSTVVRADISGKVMAIGIQSILHYKVADYTKVVKKNWVEFDINPSGVPAQFENEEAKLAAEQEEVVKEIPYLDYLTLCIRAMDNKDYKLALSQFQLVLDQYPDDVNGLFYSAQCNYYLGNYEKAVGFYDLTMRNMINKFNEESEFYKAKSLQALGRSDEAKKLFELIVAKGKFYSQQAEKELE